LNPTPTPVAIYRVPTEEISDYAAAGGKILPRRILFEEFARARSSLVTLGIGFTVSHANLQWKGDRSKRPPYLCCCYNRGDLGNANIIAFSHPLLDDWELMEQDVERYRQRLRSAIREEMIHALQIITVKKRYDECGWRKRLYQTAEIFYESLLGTIIDELAITAEGKQAVLIAAQLYYEDWSITSMERLKETDRKLHGRLSRHRTDPTAGPDPAWRVDQRRGQRKRLGQASPFLRRKLRYHRKSLKVDGRNTAPGGS
jgi:hypothetical protein